MHKPLLLALVLVLALPLLPAAAEDDPLPGLVSRLMSATGPAAEQAAKEILAAAPGVDRVMEMIEEWADYPDPVIEGWSVRSVRYPDGIERPYHLYVPEIYEVDGRIPVLIHMHGGVSRPEMIPEEDLAGGYRDWWKDQADEYGFVVLFPLGQLGAEWWTENGAGGVHAVLNDVKTVVNVDEDRVFATGFSDGGSGAYYLSMTHPTAFAGFIPLNGHPAVASSASGRQLYLPNAASRPMYAVNTQADQLYPTASVLPFLEAFLKAGVQLRFTTYPGIGHEPAYRDEQNPLIAAFMGETARTALPEAIVWETADLALGRVDWLEVTGLGETPDVPAHRDLNVIRPEGTPLLGIRIVRDFPGPGVKVENVSEGSIAADLGLVAEDVITALDDTQIEGFAALRAVLQSKRWGDDIRVTWRRGEEAMVAAGAFPPFTPAPVFSRKVASGRIAVRADGNQIEVSRSGVTAYTLSISPDRFDLEAEIVVTDNGEEVFRGKVEPGLEVFLKSFLRDRDRVAEYVGEIKIRHGD